MSDRILVLHEGAITAEIPRTDATEEGVMYAATGNVEADLASLASRHRADGDRPAVPERRRWLSDRCRGPGRHDWRGLLVGTIARQRELSLVVVMLVLGGAGGDRRRRSS